MKDRRWTRESLRVSCETLHYRTFIQHTVCLHAQVAGSSSTGGGNETTFHSGLLLTARGSSTRVHQLWLTVCCVTWVTLCFERLELPGRAG
jgi:hypothetical protein